MLTKIKLLKIIRIKKSKHYLDYLSCIENTHKKKNCSA